MSLIELPEELLGKIWDQLSDNKSSFGMAMTCRKFYDLSRKEGYIRHLSAGALLDDDITTCITRYFSHVRSLNSLRVERIDDPQLWFSSVLPSTTIFSRCLFTRAIDPPNSLTKTLVIQNFKRQSKLVINWKKFPKLELLDVYDKDVDLTGIEDCQNLMCIRIDVLETKVLDTANMLKLKQCYITDFDSSQTRFNNSGEKIHVRTINIQSIDLVPQT